MTPKKPVPLIYLEPGARLNIKNVAIVGGEVGIEGGAGSAINAHGLHFDNVKQPFSFPDGAGPTSLAQTRISNDPKAGTISQTGWRKAGPALPAYCPKCKAVFPSKNYQLNSPRFLSDDNEETCENCRYPHAKVSDGIFNLTKELIEIIQAPDFTLDMFEDLRKASEELSSGQISAAQIIPVYDSINSQLGKIITRAFKEYGTSAIAYLSLAVALATYALQKEGTDVAKEQLRLQIESNTSSDAATAQVLQALSGIKATLESGIQNREPVPTRGRMNAAVSRSDDQTWRASKSASKSKARQLRKKALLAKRKAFNPRLPRP